MALFRKNKSELRSTYRVAPSSIDGKLWLNLPSGAVEARLVDLSAGGCGCELAADVGASLHVGDSLKLQIVIGGAGASKLYLRAIVRSTSKSDKQTVRLGMSFEGMERVFLQLRDHQWRYFNRRSAFRMGPIRSDGERENVRFSVPGRSELLVLPIHDLSANGLSVMLRPGESSEFPEYEPIQAQFDLEAAGAMSFDLVVRVVHQTPVDGRIRVGFVIDEDGTPRSEEQCDGVANYVIERQRLALAGA